MESMMKGNYMQAGIDYLLQNAGPVIRYRVRGELMDEGTPELQEADYQELLALPIVRKRLDALTSLNYEHIQGCGPDRLENVLPMLGEFGLRVGVEAFDERFDSGHAFAACQRTPRARLIAYAILLHAGLRDNRLVDFFAQRAQWIDEYTANGDYDVFESPSTYSSIPKGYRDRPILRNDWYDNGNMRFPTIYDLIGLAPIYSLVDQTTRARIDRIIRYVLDPRYAVTYTYQIVTCSAGKFHTVGAYCFAPEYTQELVNAKFAGSIFYLERLSCFKAAVESDWFQNNMGYFASQQIGRDVYLLSDRHLIECTLGWVFGMHMSLGESRRKSVYREIESTFRMMRIRKNAQTAMQQGG